MHRRSCRLLASTFVTLALLAGTGRMMLLTAGAAQLAPKVVQSSSSLRLA